MSQRKRYPDSTPCPLCRPCPECGLTAHDDKPTMHAPRCSKREEWTCHAIPALTGKPCGHRNVGGIKGHDGALCCVECGCTKIASTARAKGRSPR